MHYVHELLTFIVCIIALHQGLTVCAAPKVHEAVVPPAGWVKRGRPHPEHTLTLRIGLSRPHFSVLEQHLYEVSDPAHPRYGAHLSKEEVDGLVAPHPESVRFVDEWLASYGFVGDVVMRSAAMDWVRLTVPVRVLEKMLDTEYHVWVHDERGETVVRTTEYSLPEHLHPHIEVVQPTTMFSHLRGMRSTIRWSRIDGAESGPGTPISSTKFVNTSRGLIDQSCNTTITISCLHQLYEINGYVPTAHPNNSIGVTAYLEEWANLVDLRSFYAEQRPDAVDTSFSFVSVNGGINDQNLSHAGGEASLDVQFAFGLTFPIKATFYSTAGRPPFVPDTQTPNNTNEPYQDWLDHVLAESDPPRVISTSYGDDEQTIPLSYATRICQEFAQLGARGITLIFSSGDNGVGDGNSDPNSQQCFTNDGQNKTRFLPLFPASCPFVTAVGGTQYIDPEVAVSRYYSGGGFSNYFSRPAYQDDAVKAYLDLIPNSTYQDMFNRTGRAYPDVSAQGEGFRVWVSGKPSAIGGTSAAAPVFAGVVALLNDVRLSNGLPPLGFLNPWLYSSVKTGFNDIVDGRNPGCGTLGFQATTGWDPVTGLGTPNFKKLKGAVVVSVKNHSGARRRSQVYHIFVFSLLLVIIVIVL